MVKPVTQRFYFFEAILHHFEARFFLGLQYYTISQTLVTFRTVYLRFNIVKLLAHAAMIIINL